jgi:hypothetical protein
MIRIVALVAPLALAACAQSNTQVLPPYQLANGQVLQDVVSVAADPSGGAPVITALTTYDVDAGGRTQVVTHAQSSAPGTGQALASGAGRVAAGVTAAVVTAAVIEEIDDDGGGGTVGNSTFNTSGNTATRGDAGDIDAQTVVCLGAGREACTPSN